MKLTLFVLNGNLSITRVFLYKWWWLISQLRLRLMNKWKLLTFLKNTRFKTSRSRLLYCWIVIFSIKLPLLFREKSLMISAVLMTIKQSIVLDLMQIWKPILFSLKLIKIIGVNKLLRKYIGHTNMLCR